MFSTEEASTIIYGTIQKTEIPTIQSFTVQVHLHKDLLPYLRIILYSHLFQNPESTVQAIVQSFKIPIKTNGTLSIIA